MTIGLIRSRGWEVGGAFQFDKLIMHRLAADLAGLPDRLVYLSPPTDALKALVRLDVLSYAGIPIKAFEAESFVQKPVEAYLTPPPAVAAPAGTGLPPCNGALRARLEQLQVDWLFLLEPSGWGVECRTPFIMPIHDLMHRQHPHFAEISQGGEFVRRERLYRHACRYAALILVDSETGRQDVLDAYGDVIDADRIRILPFVAAWPSAGANRPGPAEVRLKYRLPARYLFYPAQFWAHKNHASIVLAMEILKREAGLDVELVLTGSYTSHDRAQVFKTLLEIADALGLAGRIHYLGYVPDDDMPALYEGAAAMVMPSFFGPTNLPIVEAWELGCPVITARIRGITEMAGAAALLVAPDDPRDLAAAIRRIWTDETLRQDLIRRGRDQAAARDPEAFGAAVRAIVAEADARIKIGAAPRFPEEA